MSITPAAHEHVANSNATLRSYVIGFILSIILTATAFSVVEIHLHAGVDSLSQQGMLFVLAALALIQCIVQLLFFLHLGREKKPRWKLFVFMFMLMVITIIAGGSLWIMSNLTYHMTPGQVNTYLKSQDGL